MPASSVLARVFYDSSVAQSVLSAQVARQYFKIKNYTITLTDTKGLNESGMAGLISAITITTLAEIAVACGTQATYSTAGKFTYDQVALLDSLLATNNKGASVNAGTCQSNSTVTNIVLASTASAVDDTYNGMYIKTAGTTPVFRKILDYTGSSRIATVLTTTNGCYYN